MCRLWPPKAHFWPKGHSLSQYLHKTLDLVMSNNEFRLLNETRSFGFLLNFSRHLQNSIIDWVMYNYCLKTLFFLSFGFFGLVNSSLSRSIGLANRQHQEVMRQGATTFLINSFLFFISADETDHGLGLCGWILTLLSWGLVSLFSLHKCLIWEK